ncbi:hypothetical protein [Sulfobacillus harzensis]|uniref:Type II toxin-antitoxin system mRNA interferase toxin, RelE/StbE family n=1 Tax=Sulfobacillus harzensis TaxID=2729629 RepID=A0A7Y0Q3N3_9FIRM|nr:hypothetical protein [Sulfobacillus harzensis]NMP23732.1 hypothetical protein [Sulfobacillus harzensis]
MELEITPRFRRQWTRLAPENQKRVALALGKLRSGRGLRKKLTRRTDVRELRVSRDLRLLYRGVGPDDIVVLGVGTHDALDRL